jgi:hypothetical protein
MPATILTPVNDSKKIYDLREINKKRRQIDSVYILPKVKFVEMNGMEIPVLDENIFKKVEANVKTESKILTEV